MSILSFDTRPHPAFTALITTLPGPDRKRTAAAYFYRLTYRNPDPEAVGCVMTWEVEGGRQPYQLAIERDDAGSLRVHCTCADAVFRAEEEGRFCKHVAGFLQVGKDLQAQAAALPLDLRPAS
jgi:hypothetical protein